MEKLVELLKEESLNLVELQQVTGFSRIRTSVILGHLIREGTVSVPTEPSSPIPEETSQTDKDKTDMKITPLKFLFLFCDEKSATETLNHILETFNEKRISGIKAGVADFIKASILGQPVHFFTLQGKRGFEFLYEPLIPASDAVMYLLSCERDVEEYRYFRKRLNSIGPKPCFPICPASVEIQGEDVYPLTGSDATNNLFLKVFSAV